MMQNEGRMMQNDAEMILNWFFNDCNIIILEHVRNDVCGWSATYIMPDMMYVAGQALTPCLIYLYTFVFKYIYIYIYTYIYLYI